MNLYQYFKALASNENKMANPVILSYNEDETLVSIKYNQFSPTFSWDIPFMKNARGLVLDTKTGDIVALPYPKFFNYGEQHSFWPEHFKTISVQEKLDGSLVIVSSYKDELLVASSGSLTSEHASLFKDYFERTLDPQQKEALYNLARHYTLLFEYVSPRNRIVLNYQEEKMVLHGVIRTNSDLNNVKEFSRASLKEFSKAIGIELVREYPMRSFTEIKEFIDNKTNFEGFVVKFDQTYRIKFKTEDYVRLHGLATELDLTLDTPKLRDYLINAIIGDYTDDITPFLSDATKVILKEMIVEQKQFTEDAFKLKSSYLAQKQEVPKIDYDQFEEAYSSYLTDLDALISSLKEEYSTYRDTRTLEEQGEKGFSFFESTHGDIFNKERKLFKKFKTNAKVSGFLNKNILTSEQKREAARRELTSTYDKDLNTFLFTDNLYAALESDLRHKFL